MKFAFLISAHTDAPQLARLIDALPDSSFFFIHIDAKSDINQFVKLLGADPRVRFISHRVNVMWGSLVEVEYQMELIRAALISGETFDYLITISGMDYPLWDKERMTQFFENGKGKEYLCGMDITEHGKTSDIYRIHRFYNSRPWRYCSWKSKFRVVLRKIVAALGVRKPLVFNANYKTYRLFKGSAWWAISPKLSAFVLKEWDENVELRSYFRTSFCPAETLIQTIAFNSEWREHCITKEGVWKDLQYVTPLTYINYNDAEQKPMKVLDESDFDIVMGSGKMFARKVVSGQSDRLVEMIRASWQKATEE